MYIYWKYRSNMYEDELWLNEWNPNQTCLHFSKHYFEDVNCITTIHFCKYMIVVPNLQRLFYDHMICLSSFSWAKFYWFISILISYFLFWQYAGKSYKIIHYIIDKVNSVAGPQYHIIYVLIYFFVIYLYFFYHCTN